MRLVTLPGVFRPISDTWLLADALDGEDLKPRRGPLMNGRRAHLEAEGLLDPGQREEDVLVLRGRKRACAR